MIENPKVSVVLTSYNHEKFLREAIDSVLAQTFCDYELIIWDDASTDGSWDIIKNYDNSQMRVYRNGTNEIRGSLNKMIQHAARGEYIAVHHSDDVWEPTKLEKQVAFLDNNPLVGAVFSDASIINEKGNPLEDETHFYQHIFTQPNRSRYEWLNYFFYKGNALCHPSALVRKVAYSAVGAYRDIFLQLDDFDLWVRLCMKYEIHVLPEKLVRFRILDNEKNASASRSDSRIRSTFEIFKALNHYREIPDIPTLIKIFPESEQIVKNEKDDVQFILGKIAINSRNNPTSNLFGMLLLSEVLTDPERASHVYDLHGFTKKDFYEITGSMDVFSCENNRIRVNKVYEQEYKVYNLTAQNSEQERQIQVLQKQNSVLEQKIQSLNEQLNQAQDEVQKAKKEILEYALSKSWRLTRPLRKIKNSLWKGVPRKY